MKLSKELLNVAVEIYRLNEAGEVSCFSNLRENTGLPSTKIHLALDNLIDIGMIDAEWDLFGNTWVRKFTINHISRDFIKEVYDNNSPRL